MNAIQCWYCGDIIVPRFIGVVQKCYCGEVEILAVESTEKTPWIVEVKIDKRKSNYRTGARVVKINNHYLNGEVDAHTFTQTQMDTNDLFYQKQSQIIIESLDTQGVKLVDEWSYFTNEADK